MNKNQKTKEKTCAFYASDYHFEMISLPYINKKLDESKEVIVLTENNLKETIKKLVSKINLNEDKKVDILKIDWENNDLNKFKKINEDIKSKKDMVIFVKGKENYIKDWVEGDIVGIYDFDEFTKAGGYIRLLNPELGDDVCIIEDSDFLDTDKTFADIFPNMEHLKLYYIDNLAYSIDKITEGDK